MTTLQNKTALVTGASRGIGRATAAALAGAGAHVLVHYGRSAQEAESLVSEIHTKGGRANAFSADLGTPNGAALVAKQVRSIVGDRLDVLVSNAGISKAATIKDHTVEDFDNLFATNLQFFLPYKGEGDHPDLWGFGDGKRAFFWIKQGKPDPASVHWGFMAENNGKVDEFYRAAISAGARDNISPRARVEYYPGYYAADVFDPDGYSFEVVHKS